MIEALGDAHAAARACMEILKPYEGKYAIVIILAETNAKNGEIALTSNIADRNKIGALLLTQILRVASDGPDHVGDVKEAGING